MNAERGESSPLDLGCLKTHDGQKRAHNAVCQAGQQTTAAPLLDFVAPTLVTVSLHVWPKMLIMCEMTCDKLALKLEPWGSGSAL